MKKLIILIFIAIIHNSCQDGPQARYNEDFEEFDRYKELSFSKLIGKYELDKDSKTRYNLPDSLELYVNLKIDKKDTLLFVNRYVSPIDRTIVDKKISNKILYFEDSKTIHTFNNNEFLGGGTISIYIRTKDSVLTLYAYTPFIPATEENGMQYKEGDYLRYIKVD